MCDSSVPDFILSSGFAAQQSRNRVPRRSSVQTATPRNSIDSSIRDNMSTRSALSLPPPHTVEMVDLVTLDSCNPEIKSVLGYVPSAQKAWPRDAQFDMPRLVKL